MFSDSFKKKYSTSKESTYLKYVIDQYMTQLVKNPKYDRSVIIPKREWKNVLEDAKDIALRHEGKTPPGPIR
jgi:hypothetical protein